MFWKKNKKPQHSLEYLRLLHWGRSRQDFLLWKECKGASDFKQIWSTLPSCVAIFEQEVSILDSLADLAGSMQVLEQKAVETVSHWKNQSTQKPFLVFKKVAKGNNRFNITPFLEFPPASTLPFLPVRQQKLDFSLELTFCTVEVAKKVFEQYRSNWIDQIDTQKIDTFLTKRVQDTVIRHFKRLRKANHFDTLRIILENIDTQALQLSTHKSSIEYLKDVWEIPVYVFAQVPEEAALIHLKLKKRFTEIRKILYAQISQQYLSYLLQWTFEHPLTFQEAAYIFMLGKEDTEKIVKSIPDILRIVAEKIGITIEIEELFGPNVFVEKATKSINLALQKKEGTLEYLRTTLSKKFHSVRAEPDQVVQNILEILRQRLKQYAELELSTQRQLHQWISST